MSSSGHNMSPSIFGLPICMTVGVWCNEFHHSTEYLMMGTFTTPTTASTALALSAFTGSSMPARRPIYPRYRNSRISSDVRRGSQTQ